MLEINGLTKTYKGGKKAVDNVSLHVDSGDIFGFIGHNGAGKSTTIRCIVGILGFDEGDIFVDGVSVRDNPLEAKKRIAYIPDNPDIYDYLTGIQYLTFIADIFDIPKSARGERIDRYAKAFEIEGDLGRLISSYSHGMKQKLCLIGALIHEPKLLVLDEPFVGLDPKSAHTLKEFMRETCSNGGAIFFSTHVLPVAETLCNRIAVIKSGRIIAQGDTAKIKGDSSLENVFLELTEQ